MVMTLHVTVFYIILFTFLIEWPYLFEKTYDINQGFKNTTFVGMFLGMQFISVLVPFIYGKTVHASRLSESPESKRPKFSPEIPLYAELSEVINSMFQWYEQAEACFAYLCDISAGQDPKAVGSDFRKSRWFTRGWTLQELLAPFRVVFLDGGWNKIGSRDSLGSVIEESTGIGSAYINGTADKSTGFYRNRRVLLPGASVAERMSWAAKRGTTREEDMAYCHLGLFEMHRPLIYGEGGSAFPRLQEAIMKVSGDSSILTWRYRLLPNAYS
ncbi:hypothetical protein CDV36_010663 [Fusarium kuroshium]|uniref:Heterokaryon incompatibility domain-containing protein n=1 Tax=Fusarium kuroshium TaxID=2010991 RepID=A0A3M2RX35_9HYPO|nr:hypothetical protein CDV36_010663 [Fusarium kuroshium]